MADNLERDQSLVGTRLGNRYEIRSEIGHGGMGVVYYGYDTLLQRVVAIKVLPSSLTYDRQFVERFRQEAVAAAGLHHTGIVTIHDVGEAILGEQGQRRVYFIVMQYLEGTTLDALLESRGPLSLQQANHLVRQLGDALDYAHARNMIHRDIKPSNIMVGPDGHATIMDFGLVRAGEGTGLTRTGMVVGTPEYMAPEQALGEPVDARTDIYSFGVVIYKMLCGQVPFTRSTSMATAYAHVHEPPPPLRQMRPDILKPVEAVVLKALAKAPADRYQRAGLLADDFAVALTNKTPAGLKIATTGAAGAATASLAASRGKETKSSTPRPGKTPTPEPYAAAAGADATQLVESAGARATALGSGGAGRAGGPPPAAAPAGRRSPGLGVIGLVAVLLIAVAAAAVLMLSGRNRSGQPDGLAQGGGGQPTAAATVPVVAVVPTNPPAPATATAIPPATTAPTRTLPPTAAPSATAAPPTASPTASQTPTPPPPTATPRPTSSSTPTAAPSATPTASQTPTPVPPTASPTASQAATRAATATTAAQQPTATQRPAQTPTPTPRPAPTATKPPAAPAAPSLVAPAAGEVLTGETTFTWQWNGPALAPNQAFELRLWKEGQPDHYGATGLTRGTSVSFNVGGAYGVQQGGNGSYLWTVAVVQADPYQRLGEEAPPRSVTVELSSGGGGGGGGGGEPTPTPA